MRLLLALGLLAIPISQARPAPLDDWCNTATLPSSIAICSDAELRSLAVERQQAFDEASARLDAKRRVELLADQKGWVASYAVACGVAQNVQPALPLAPDVKACLMRAGHARIAYLRAYGSPPTAPLKPTVATIAFQQGQADRQSWETWFSSQTGDYRAGADYWASHRSLPKPEPCSAVPPSTGADWTAGCLAAQRKLAAPDVRRKTEPEYRLGWNSPPPRSPTQAPSPTAAAPSTTPPAAETVPTPTPATASPLNPKQPTTSPPGTTAGQDGGNPISQSDPVVTWCTEKNAPIASSIASCIEQSRRQGPALACCNDRACPDRAHRCIHAHQTVSA